MKYKYKNGVSKKSSKRALTVGLPLVGIVAGCYLLINVFTPAIPTTLSGSTATVTNTVKATQPTSEGNRLYIPKIGVDVEIVTGVTDDTLEGGAWHRKPENGDPSAGGNFVLAAHRFNLGMTPIQTRALSPFYHIDKLEAGDEVYADYGGQRYAYEIVNKYSVDEDAVHIEEKSDDDKMTLYSCDLNGPEAGREVIEAKLVGTVAWNEGQPRIQATP